MSGHVVLQDGLPETIDQVLERLNGMLDAAVRVGERIGYFTALYERVTTNVRRAIIAGNVFEDNARMQRLDVVFANRYLDAWDRHSRGDRPTESWQVAFALLSDPAPLVIQHLLLGMNAHINLDLGIAAATVAPSVPELDALWPDFKQINHVLARLVRVVEDELCQIAPRLQRIADIATIEEKLFKFGIDTARDVAWAFAQELVRTPRSGWDGVIARRDVIVAETGRAIYPLHGPAGEVQRWVHAQECQDVRFTIQVVAA